MIRIGIDAQIASVSKAGLGYFTSSVLRLLPAVDQTAEYVPLQPRAVRDFSMPQRWWWDQVALPRLVQRERIDVLFKPAFSCPVRLSVPTVVTVHDLAARRFPEQLHRPSAWFYGRWSPWTWKFAKRIIAISEFTKGELVSELGMNAESIDVVIQGSDVVPAGDAAGDDQVLTSLGLSDTPYILHVGTLEPRKNLAFLVRTFARFHAAHPEYVLVLAGNDGWLSHDVHATVESLGLTTAVRFTGGVSDAVKYALYRNARVVAFPSLYEGFGRPPLEAMECGTPVVAAATSSIPEVVGDAGILVSGYDEDAWAAALWSAAGDETVRQRLRAAGFARSTALDWNDAARHIATILHHVAHA